MRTVQPGATCNMQHAVALSCTASVINIDAAASNDATAAYDMSAAAAAFAAADANDMHTSAASASAFAFSKPYCTASPHKDAHRNAGLATAPKCLQVARTEFNVKRACARACARPTAAATTHSNVCCTNARRLPS
jgi:hypothetical protein